MATTYDLTTIEAAQEYLHAGKANAAMLGRLIAAATQVMEYYTGRRFVSRAYTEWLSGDGSQRLYPNNWPISTLTRVCAGAREVARIYNTSADAAYALVSVSATGLTLIVAGGTNAGTDATVTWTSNTTITAVVAAVNALGKGWVAEVLGNRGAFPSTEIRPVGAAAALNSTHGNSQLDLYAPEEPLPEVYIDAEARFIHMPRGFPWGRLNIYLAYTAGYATSDQTYSHLQQICLEIVARMYGKQGKGGGAFRSESLDGYSYTLAAETELQGDVLAMLQPYMRVMV